MIVNHTQCIQYPRRLVAQWKSNANFVKGRPTVGSGAGKGRSCGFICFAAASTRVGYRESQGERGLSRRNPHGKHLGETVMYPGTTTCLESGLQAKNVREKETRILRKANRVLRQQLLRFMLRTRNNVSTRPRPYSEPQWDLICGLSV